MYQCSICEKKFETRFAYNGHKQSHTQHKLRGEGKKSKSKSPISEIHKCKFCGKQFESGRQLGGHTGGCSKNPNSTKKLKLLSDIAKTQKHTPETKEKMSKSRREYLRKNPDQVPYRLYHSSNESWPESVIRKSLISENIADWTQEYAMGIYSVDFAFPNKKLAIEIDGSTHLIDSVKRKDKIRDEYLSEQGWKTIRFTAKRVKHDLQGVINDIKNALVA